MPKMTRPCRRSRTKGLHVPPTFSPNAFDRNSSSLEEYIYSILQKGRKQIRVFTLEPASWKDAIEGSVRLEDMNEACRAGYQTVSYAWGDPTRRMSIAVDGRQLAVPANTVAALRRLRLRDQPRRIWIDAICINQRDLDERNHQVSIMREVYGNASENLIYLGEARFKIAVAAASSLAAIVAEIPSTRDGRASLTEILFDNNGNRQYCDDGIVGEVDFHALQLLLSTSWFSRLWVMQEAAVSRTSTCFLGEVSFPLVLVVRAAVWLHYKQNSIPHSLSDSLGVQNGCLLWDYIDPESPVHASKGSSIAQALTFAKNLTTSEPRDSVYGSLGLMKCLQNADEIPFELCPDYNRKLVDVSRDAMRAALYEDNGKHSECLLQLISHRSEDDLENFEWPSWVPFWHRSWEHRSDAGPFGTFFLADENMQLPKRTLARVGDPNRLTLIGCILDTIQDRSPVLTDRCLESSLSFCGWVSAATSFAQGLHDTFDESKLASVLIAGSNAEGKPSTERDLSFMRYSTKGEYLSDKNLLNPILPEAHREAQRFRIALRNACTNRRLFSTTNGRLGLGPNVTKQGDYVSLLYGFRTPYILRKYGHGNTFRIVGEAYLQGAMYGEDLRAHKRLGRPDNTFVIL